MIAQSTPYHCLSTKDKARSTVSGAAQNGQCMTSMYRESDKRAHGSFAFEWLSRYFDVIHCPFCAAPLMSNAPIVIQRAAVPHVTSRAREPGWM